MRRLLLLGGLLVALAGCGPHHHWQHAHHGHASETHRTTDAHDTRPPVDRRVLSPYHQIGADVAHRWRARWRQNR